MFVGAIGKVLNLARGDDVGMVCDFAEGDRMRL